MKKIALLVFLITAITINAYSQNEKFFRFGMNASTGFAWIKPDTKTIEYQGMKLGFGYGFIGEFTIADNFSFASGFEVQYSGGKIQNTNAIVNFPNGSATYVDSSAIQTSTIRLQYLEFPLTLKMKTNEINYLTYFLRVGGSVGIKLNANSDEDYKSNTPGISNFSEQDVDINKNINFFRAAFVVGGGFEYSLGGSTTALVELTFNNGLTDIFDEENKGINNYMMLKLGIIF